LSNASRSLKAAALGLLHFFLTMDIVMGINSLPDS
jgi:hypothetical protein